MERGLSEGVTTRMQLVPAREGSQGNDEGQRVARGEHSKTGMARAGATRGQ